jgi:hypothetical protein
MGLPNDGTALARGFGQPDIALIAVDLKDAVKAFKDCLGVLVRPTGCIEVNNAGWFFAAPWSIIAGQRPEISYLGFAAPRIPHRGRGVIHKQFVGSFQVLG